MVEHTIIIILNLICVLETLNGRCELLCDAREEQGKIEKVLSLDFLLCNILRNIEYCSTLLKLL